MSGAVVASTSATSHIAQVSGAIKACGTIVKLEPEDFLKILSRQEQPLVIQTSGGTFSRSNKYLTSYKGLAFYCKTQEQLRLPAAAELITAKKFTVPDL